MIHPVANRFSPSGQLGDSGPENMMSALEQLEIELRNCRRYNSYDGIEDRIDRLEITVEILIGFLKFQILK